jgi:hypothetical protein
VKNLTNGNTREQKQPEWLLLIRQSSQHLEHKSRPQGTILPWWAGRCCTKHWPNRRRQWDGAYRWISNLQVKKLYLNYKSSSNGIVDCPHKTIVFQLLVKNACGYAHQLLVWNKWQMWRSTHVFCTCFSLWNSNVNHNSPFN